MAKINKMFYYIEILVLNKKDWEIELKMLKTTSKKTKNDYIVNMGEENLI